MDLRNLQIYSIYRIISLDLDELTMPKRKRTITSQFSKRPPLESIYSPSFHNKFNCSLHRSIIYMPHLCNTGLFLIMWWEKRFKLKFNHFILDIGWWPEDVKDVLISWYEQIISKYLTFYYLNHSASMTTSSWSINMNKVEFCIKISKTY